MSRNQTARPTTARTDLITVLFGAWLMIGLFLDGYAHTNLIDELESFVTPWHAVFYSGFVATAAWVMWTIANRMGGAGNLLAAIPPGYGLALIGIVVFAVGGVGDAVWHTVLGIEQGVDALLSPTHLLLFSGMLLVLTTPIRAVYLRRTRERLSGLDGYSVALSVTLSTALLAFFFFYLWAPGRPWMPEQTYNGATGDGEFAVAFGMAAILVSNLIFLAPLAVVLGRWRPPVGLATLAWTAASGMTAAAFDLELTLALVVGVAGGIAADVVVAITGAGPTRRVGTVLTMTVAPMFAWSAYFAGIAIWGDLQWPPEVWGGAISFAALSGLGLTMIGPPPRPGESRPAESGAVVSATVD